LFGFQETNSREKTEAKVAKLNKIAYRKDQKDAKKEKMKKNREAWRKKRAEKRNKIKAKKRELKTNTGNSTNKN
jgi:hypothetical protein